MSLKTKIRVEYDRWEPASEMDQFYGDNSPNRMIEFFVGSYFRINNDDGVYEIYNTDNQLVAVIPKEKVLSMSIIKD